MAVRVQDGAFGPRTPAEPTTVATEVDIVEIREEEGRGVAEDASLKMYTEWNSKRNDERAKLEVEAEEAWEFRVGESLRVEWGQLVQYLWTKFAGWKLVLVLPLHLILTHMDNLEHSRDEP